MSEQKEYLRKLVKTIVFLLAFAVSGIASIGIFGFLMGAAAGVGSLAMGGVASIGAAGAALIPKLFEQSPKSKANEIGPAAETWSKLQQAYMMETDKVGDCQQISYKLPGEGQTVNFTYGCGIQRDGSAYWVAKNNENLGDCPAGSQWALLMISGDAEPEVLLPENKACQKLTPNFGKLGKTAQEKEEAAKKAAEEEAAKQAAAAEEEAKKAAEEAEQIMKGLAGGAEESIDDIMKMLEGADDGESAAAKAELEKEAKKWNSSTVYNDDGGWTSKYKSTEGKFFSFFGESNSGEVYWKATSKAKIGNCPAKSVWLMSESQEYSERDAPAKCEAITPKELFPDRSGDEEDYH